MSVSLSVHALAAALSALALICCARKPPTGPAAGLYAARGDGRVTRELPPLVRHARPGMTLGFDMELELEGEAVLEGLNGAFVPLGKGRHKIASMNALRLPSPVTRPVLWIADVVQERQVGTLVEPSRYEPLESGKPFKEPGSDSFAENVAFLFLPHDNAPPKPERPTGAPPSWNGTLGFIRPLHRQLAQGDGSRTLVQADGSIVVEFDDRATVLTGDLKLPLDLQGVRRIVVARGAARLALPGGRAVDLGEGQIAEIAPLP